MYKVYTRKGDKGQTNVLGKGNVHKSHELVDLSGSNDELQVQIGVLISFLDSEPEKKFLKGIQMKLLEIGASFSKESKDESFSDLCVILESKIDTISNELPVLKEFILAGSNVQESHAHLCRVVCRRFERNIWKCFQMDNFPNIKKFINRLSDFFFVYARHLANEETRYKISKKRETHVDM